MLMVLFVFFVLVLFLSVLFNGLTEGEIYRNYRKDYNETTFRDEKNKVINKVNGWRLRTGLTHIAYTIVGVGVALGWFFGALLSAYVWVILFNHSFRYILFKQKEN